MDYIGLLRQFKIGPFAIFDLSISYLGIYLLAPILSKFIRLFGIAVGLESWMWLTLPIAIVFHLLFRQNTPLSMMFFDMSGNYVIKILLLFMLIMGTSKMRRLK